MSTNKLLKPALNGCNEQVSLKNIPIYHWWESGITPQELGSPLDKDAWIRANVNDNDGCFVVGQMLQDWTLYQNGWIVSGNHRALFNYKCQLGTTRRPPALNYLD